MEPDLGHPIPDHPLPPLIPKSYRLPLPLYLINNCSIEELMTVPGIGAKVADKILELREAKGDLELDDLNQVPYLRITQPLLDCLDILGRFCLLLFKIDNVKQNTNKI
jgi:hypothetical protein